MYSLGFAKIGYAYEGMTGVRGIQKR